MWLLHYLLLQPRRPRLFYHASHDKKRKERIARVKNGGAAPSTSGDIEAGGSGENNAATNAQIVTELLSCCQNLYKLYWPFLINIGIVQSFLVDLHMNRLPFFSLFNSFYKQPEFHREELIASDGGRILLALAVDTDLKEDDPIVLIFPGNLGDSTAAYMRSIFREFARKHWRAAVYIRRGCGENELVTPKPQDYADEEDCQLCLGRIKERYPKAPLVAVGYSLGANFLVRHLGLTARKGGKSPILAAVALGNPWNLVGLSYYLKYHARVIDWGLRQSLKENIRTNFHTLDSHKNLDPKRMLACASYREITKRFHLKLYGYSHLDRYLEESSSCHVLKYVDVPLLCVNAEDDPVCPPGLIPFEEFLENPHVVLAKTDAGGHHAYLPIIPLTSKWSDVLVCQWLDGFLQRHVASQKESGEKL